MIKLKSLLETIEKVDYPMNQLPGGAWKEGPADWTKFKVGGVYNDGDIHRFVVSQHRDYEDDDRITGNFKLTKVNPQTIPESDYWIDDDKVRLLAKSSKPYPPIVVDRKGGIIDGGHRLEAAKHRGDESILVFRQL